MNDAAVPPLPRTVLRDLPLSARLVLALFMISVGLGYFSALVQLHFQQAPAGKLLPGADEAKATYSSKPGVSQLERGHLARSQRDRRLGRELGRDAGGVRHFGCLVRPDL